MISAGCVNRILCTAAGILLLGAMAGCGNSSYPKCIQVGGRVTYHGKPVATGSISFTPQGQPTGQAISRPAAGSLAADGSYALTSFREGDGVQPGEYVVTVVSVDRSAGGSSRDKPPIAGFSVPSLIPRKYALPTTSGLKAAVPTDASGRLQFNFDLTD